MKIFLIVTLMSIACFNLSFADLVDRPVILSPDKEAWLTGNLDSTLAILEKMIAQGQNTAINSYNAGYLYLLKGDKNTAMKYINKSLELPNPSPYAYLLLAQIYRTSGFVSAAYQHIQTALEIDPVNYDFLLESAQLNELSGRLEQAKNIYIDLIEKWEDKIPPRIKLAELYRRQKKYTEAKAALEPVVPVYPESDLLITRARLYSEMGDESRAAGSILEMCRAYPFASETEKYLDTLKLKYGMIKPDILPTVTKFRFQFIPAEKVDYKVSYGFITLGWVNVRVGNPVMIHGKNAYPVRFYINTNPDFSMLLSLNHVYESYIEAGTLNAIRTRQYTPDENGYLVKMYDFYYEKNKMDLHLVYSDGRFKLVEKLLPSSAQDAVSMLYFARGVVSNKTGGSTTVVIDEDYKYGHITYLDEKEEVEVLDKDVEAIKIFARAEFKGIAGMNGDAWGWFSDDSRFAPLVGKIKILLGSITVDLDDTGPLAGKKLN